MKIRKTNYRFVINYFKQEFSPIELYEYTRGFWYNPPTDQNIKYAYYLD